MARGERVTGYGWDSQAFFYPTRSSGPLLTVAAVLFLLHFDEVFGLHTKTTLLFNILPIEFGYQLGMSLIHVLFAYLLFRQWPDRNEQVGEP